MSGMVHSGGCWRRGAVTGPRTDNLMTMRVRHDTFTIDFELAVPPATVFEAFTDSAIRRRWFRPPGPGRGL